MRNFDSNLQSYALSAQPWVGRGSGCPIGTRKRVHRVGLSEPAATKSNTVLRKMGTSCLLTLISTRFYDLVSSSAMGKKKGGDGENTSDAAPEEERRKGGPSPKVVPIGARMRATKKQQADEDEEDTTGKVLGCSRARLVCTSGTT